MEIHTLNLIRIDVKYYIDKSSDTLYISFFYCNGDYTKLHNEFFSQSILYSLNSVRRHSIASGICSKTVNKDTNDRNNCNDSNYSNCNCNNGNTINNCNYSNNDNKIIKK